MKTFRQYVEEVEVNKKYYDKQLARLEELKSELERYEPLSAERKSVQDYIEALEAFIKTLKVVD